MKHFIQLIALAMMMIGPATYAADVQCGEVKANEIMVAIQSFKHLHPENCKVRLVRQVVALADLGLDRKKQYWVTTWTAADCPDCFRECGPMWGNGSFRVDWDSSINNSTCRVLEEGTPSN